jgi:hypothetical protein
MSRHHREVMRDWQAAHGASFPAYACSPRLPSPSLQKPGSPTGHFYYTTLLCGHPCLSKIS